MVSKITSIRNPRGIHVRPAMMMEAEFLPYPGKIKVENRWGESVLFESSMALISLALTAGQLVKVTVEGPDEDNICQRLCSSLSAIYEFDD